MSVIKKYKSNKDDFFKEMEDPKNDLYSKSNSKPKEKEIEKKVEKEELEEKEDPKSKEEDSSYVPKHNVKKNTNISSEPEIKPTLKFLESSKDPNSVFIGRKKSIAKKYDDESTAYLGNVIEEGNTSKKVKLDGLNPHVVFIDGSRGSGKSYGLGVIAEELAKNNKFIGQIVIDPVGVFWSMKFPNQEERELEFLKEWGLEPKGLDNLKVFVPEGMASQISKDTFDETFSIFPSLLDPEDWCLTFGIGRFNPTGLLLEKTLTFVKNGYIAGDPKADDDLKEILPKGTQFTLDDIIYCLRNNSEFKSAQKGYKPDSIRALVSRFEAAKSWGIFSDHGTPLTKLSREGQLTVLDTSFLDDNITALVIGILARRILSARKLLTRQDAVKKFESSEQNVDLLLEIEIPPTWLYIDEAHTLIPSGNVQTPATAAIIEYVKQGRRPGCSMVFATQQPSAINTKVLSQVDIFISHKLVFNDDIKAIRKRMPAIIPKEYKNTNFIKTLPVGVALVGDRREETSRAFILKVKPRSSQHEGRDAETIRQVEELSDEDVISKAKKLILGKLKINQEIREGYAKDILDVVNVKHHANISWDKVLNKLKEDNVVLENNLLLIKKNKFVSKPGQNSEDVKIRNSNNDSLDSVEEKISNLERYGAQDKLLNSEANPYSKSNLEDSSKDTTINSEEINEDLEELEHKDGFICESLPLRITREQAENISKKTSKNIMSLFFNNETVNETSLKHRAIYRIKYNLFFNEENYIKKECFIDSITGEFIHFTNGVFKESKGFNLISQFKGIDLEILEKLKKKSTLYSLDQEISLSQEKLKEHIDKFKELDILLVEKKHDVEVYKLKNFDLPFKAHYKVISSIKDLPLRKKEISQISLLKEKVNLQTIKERLLSLWDNIEIIEDSILYWPNWEITLVNKKQESRKVLVDATIGHILE